ncbi:MAG: hypothetical protein LBU73_05495 [Helicobacteraceae bacterium]|jgi:hypothetical protein|nr:hypothetical protein [Helicobacteraceae bacterium]
MRAEDLIFAADRAFMQRKRAAKARRERGKLAALAIRELKIMNKIKKFMALIKPCFAAVKGEIKAFL